MEAKLFGLKINFDSVETALFYVELLSSFDTVSSLVRKILHYLGFSLMDSSNIDLFNYLIH